MSKFFVGQRVRIIGCKPVDGRSLIGMETVITGDEHDAWRLAVDWPSTPGVRVAALKETAHRYLSPILPDGHRPSEYTFHELMDRCREGIAA